MDDDKKVVQQSPVKAALAPFRNRKHLQQDIEHITQEMYRRNKELAETNRTLSLLRAIDAMVLEQHASLRAVCMRITAAITEAADYPFVGLFTHTGHSRDELTLYGWSGKEPAASTDLIKLDRPIHLKLEVLYDLVQTVRLVSLESTPVAVMAKTLGLPETEIQSLLEKQPLKTLCVVKLVVRRHVVGVLVAGFYSPIEQLGPADTLLLERLSESIGVALDNKLLFEENQRVLRQLRDSNAKLRALDEAKDDFISMASHQLRTPLTSVKGYISMILDGDVGKITPQQKQMLNQAFFSSQRMVYLIADLLNVSRLRTGKFVIEPSPVDLSKLIAEELGQLEETVKLHGVTLTYKKPKAFPQLMLDETKTRQVIMNFVDNAIYYTPKGGHIRVELIDKPTMVELRVIDNGIGVPRAEQHHLFTKFYRAGNARKARPDGTGLGLFMAKKVVVAQGGAIIFESKEGKGSTFGFTFSKSQPATTDPTPVEA